MGRCTSWRGWTRNLRLDGVSRGRGEEGKGKGKGTIGCETEDYYCEDALHDTDGEDKRVEIRRHVGQLALLMKIFGLKTICC